MPGDTVQVTGQGQAPAGGTVSMTKSYHDSRQTRTRDPPNSTPTSNANLDRETSAREARTRSIEPQPSESGGPYGQNRLEVRLTDRGTPAAVTDRQHWHCHGPCQSKKIDLRISNSHSGP